MKASNSVSMRISLGLISVFLCSLSTVFSQESKGNSSSKNDTFSRLIYYFVIGEKATHKNPSAEQKANDYDIRERRNFDNINAFSILDLKLRNGNNVVASLRNKKQNILLVAELRKRGEKTWNRISIINRYTWRIAKVSSLNEQKMMNIAASSGTETPPKTAKTDESSGTKGPPQTVKTDESTGADNPKQTDSAQDANLRIRPFYVIDEILSESPYIREGDYVQIFFFYDVTKEQDYLNDLINAQRMSLPLVSIDAQEMYLITIGSAPQKYSARQGDEIRLRFLRAEYSVHKVRAIDALVQKHQEPEGPQKYGDVISVEDEIFFTFKEYGISLFISPTIVYGSKLGAGWDSKNFDVVGNNPSLGSNVYIAYEGRNPQKRALNYLPGIHLSLLGLNNSEETKFTIGFVTSILPVLRGYFGLFYGWYDLKEPVIGITFSPDIKFKPLVGAEKRAGK